MEAFFYWDSIGFRIALWISICCSGKSFFIRIPGFILIVFFCFMFEVFSLISDLGFYELMDAIAGVIGGILGMIILYIFISFA